MDHIGKGEAEKAKLPEKERLLMQYVKVLTLEPARVTDQQVEGLRKAGWSDNEISEASFNTALFAFFNRMAEAYGLDYGDRAWYPPSLRVKSTEKTGGVPEAGKKSPASPPARTTP